MSLFLLVEMLRWLPLQAILSVSFFYPERQSYGSFTLFQDERVSVTQQETLRQAITILEGKNEAVEEQPAKNHLGLK